MLFESCATNLKALFILYLKYNYIADKNYYDESREKSCMEEMKTKYH